MKSVCVLLPAYNEAEHISELIQTIKKVTIADLSIRILVVDDGSTDETAQVAKEAGATILSHRTNRGVGAAFRTGLHWALDEGCDFLIHLDSDGQIPANQIPALLKPVLQAKADV